MTNKGRPKGANKASLAKIESLILQYLKANPANHPNEFLIQEFHISRQAALAHLNRMIRKGLIIAQGSGRWRRYAVASKDTHDTPHILSMPILDLAKVGEDEVFRADIAPWLHNLCAENPGLRARQQYALTEILNNVIDHSLGTTVTIRLRLWSGERPTVMMEVEDDGRGIFATIKDYFHLSDHLEAVGELAKGKRTTDPSRHAGEGLFFAARMVDFFEIEANQLRYAYASPVDDWTMSSAADRRQGSLVRINMNLDDDRTPQSVFAKYTDNFEFNLQSPRIANPYLVSLPAGHLPSRSEARKILSGAEQFSSIVMDFKDVESIGQGFADEVFRVFQNKHPGITIHVKNASIFVQRMIAHVRVQSQSG
jgi:anti-sigma regulatory factor (Ser/Thr protein kinase)